MPDAGLGRKFQSAPAGAPWWTGTVLSNCVGLVFGGRLLYFARVSHTGMGIFPILSLTESISFFEHSLFKVLSLELELARTMYVHNITPYKLNTEYYEYCEWAVWLIVRDSSPERESWIRTETDNKSICQCSFGRPPTFGSLPRSVNTMKQWKLYLYYYDDERMAIRKCDCMAWQENMSLIESTCKLS